MKYVALTLCALLALALTGCGSNGGGPSTPPLVITSTSLGQAQVGAPFSFALDADGGGGSYTWSVAPSAPLPNSLSLNTATGIVSGTPVDGDESWSAESGIICNDGATSTHVMLPLTIRPRLAIAMSQFPDAMEGASFNINLNTSGGSGNAHWKLAANSGPLPAGVTLNGTTGRITGTPNAGVAGDYMVTLEASDGQATDVRVFEFRVHPAGVAVTTHELPPVQVGTTYNHILTSIGGAGLPSWTIAPTSAAQLPVGLSLQPLTGAIQGSVATDQTGSYQITFRVSFGAESDEETLELRVGTSLLSITTPALPSAREGADYVTHLSASGGTSAAYVWSIVAPSALPSGLRISSTHGLVLGRPSAGTVGTTEVTLRVSENGQNAERTLSITVHGSEQLDAKLSTTREERLHFLTRTEFGVTPASLAHLETIGLVAYVDEMLNLKATAAVEADAMQEILDPAFPNSTRMARWMMRLMMHTNAPFQETMTHFWTDHFAMSYTSFSAQSRYFFMDKHQYLRNHFAGNLRQMLIDISMQPAMLVWLDGISSRKGHINENYAREFWELFTLGVDNGYTQADIEESARVLTGFKRFFDGSRDEVVFDPARHDTGNKEIFGVTITGQSGPEAYHEIEDLVDLTLNNKPAAEFIVTKIFKHLVHDHPSEAMIDELATILRQSNWELKPMLRKMLLSNAMFSTEARKGLVKSPVEYVIGLSRSVGIEPTATWAHNQTRDAGEEIHNPPDVAGWVSGTRWLSSDALVHRTNYVSRLIIDRTGQADRNQTIDLAMPPVGFRSAQTCVDHLMSMMNIQATAAERTRYLEYMNSQADASGGLTSKPFDVNDEALVENKIRGLIMILAQHPSYHLR